MPCSRLSPITQPPPWTWRMAGRRPVDFPEGGVRQFKFASWTQAFSDAFVWSSATKDGQIRIEFASRTGDKSALVKLAAKDGDRVDVHVLNHPNMVYRSSEGPASWHLGLMKEIFASNNYHPEPESDKRCPPVGVGRGNKYCGAPMVKF